MLTKKIKVKEVWLADQTTKKAKVTLWREQCSTEFRAGDFIEITDVVTSTYRNETSRSTMQVIDAPLTEHQIAVEGISLNGQEVELLTDANEVVTVKLETLRAALPDEVETEDYFCDYSPVRLNVFSRGQNIERLVLL